MEEMVVGEETASLAREKSERDILAASFLFVRLVQEHRGGARRGVLPQGDLMGGAFSGSSHARTLAAPWPRGNRRDRVQGHDVAILQ